MSAITPEGLESSLTSDGSTVSEIVESFVESTAKLAESLDAPEKRVSDFEDSGRELAQLVEGIAQESAQARESARTNEAELKEHQEESAKERAQIKQRVTSLEDKQEEADSNDETPAPQTEETTIQEPETPLEDIIRVPEHLVEDSLSANQQRARFLAKDIHEYTRSVPAGRVIKSSELRRVLSARKEGRIHTETVSRVIDFLTDLGQDDVQVQETQQGERVVVFNDEFVKRVVAYHNTNHSVVSEGGATG
jgi:ParB-like chromosome segregation protein Spo0J